MYTVCKTPIAFFSGMPILNSHLIQLNQNLGNWSLVIGHWAFRHMEQKCNDLLEGTPNNSFPMRNSQCPKQPLVNRLYVQHHTTTLVTLFNPLFCIEKIAFKTNSHTQTPASSQEGLAQYLIFFVH